MSLRRNPSTSTRDTTIDFKEGFLPAKAPETTSMDLLRSEIADLKSKLSETKVTSTETNQAPRRHASTRHRPHRPHDEGLRHAPNHLSETKVDPVAQNVMAKLDRLEAKLKPSLMSNTQPSVNPVAMDVMAKLDKLEAKLKAPDSAPLMSKLDSIQTSVKANPVAQEVMAKLDRLEAKLKAPDSAPLMSKLDSIQTSVKANPVAQEVMAKLDRLEAKLKPDHAPLMSKLDSIQTSVQANPVAQEVMAKLDRLEAKLKPDHAPLMSKLDHLESKIHTSAHQEAVLSKLATLESKLQSHPILEKLDAIESKLQNTSNTTTNLNSEQSIKDAVFMKLAKLEEQVKLKSSMPSVTLESYNQEKDRLRKLERMRSKIAAAI